LREHRGDRVREPFQPIDDGEDDICISCDLT
jgi:hypothetical protein